MFVGNGSAHMARAFQEDFAPGSAVYTDPSRAVYKLAEFRAKGSIGKALMNAWRAFRAGFRQGRTQGHPLQLGGVFVVKQDGQVAYRYASDAAGDHPPIEDIIGALT